ncbi:bifunctional metallophosphatase/5'-nucleotidase [Patiriisocius sp. Uisw_047]|jgi:5'-nucleotidase/UDP-sugar diphosphatase|uniref:bifunctional metallophosphatase/5'-nucleotidase n=1 Tax=Patiriisocius sp. Uisw_047 TaxID=3230969 RepID=UPI0039E74AE1
MKKSILHTPYSIRYIIPVALFFLITSCKSKQLVMQPKSEVVTIKLLQVNDVYEISPLSGGKEGGMARVAYVADSIREQNPNTYLMMAGDFLNPSLVGTLKVDGKRVRGRQMIEVMNAMKFDLATFGNHEFDLKEQELQERLNESEFEWTSANVYQKNGEDVRVFHAIKEGDSIPISETIIYDIDIGKEYPLRLGVFSVTIDSNPIDYVYYSDYLLEAGSAYSALESAKSDIIVGLTHLSLAQDMKVAEAFENIDLIMGGHEHSNMYVPAGGTHIAKADANAKSMYVHTLRYDLGSEILAIDSELVLITDKTPSLPSVQAVVTTWENILDTEIKQVVGDPDEVIYFAKIPLDGTDVGGRSKQTNLGQIFSQAMAKSFDTLVDGALVNSGSFRLDDNLEGNITAIDIFRVLPFGGAVLKAEVTGELLIEILDFGESASGTGAYLQRYAMTKNNNDVWTLKGSPILDAQVYTIAFSDYLLKGFDIPFLTPENPGVKSVYIPLKTELAYDIRKVVINFMKTI